MSRCWLSRVASPPELAGTAGGAEEAIDTAFVTDHTTTQTKPAQEANFVNRTAAESPTNHHQDHNRGNLVENKAIRGTLGRKGEA